jgi:hypothetical protein
MYKLTVNENIVQRIDDGAFIPNDLANIDYQAYLKWVSEGGVVLPADETN